MNENLADIRFCLPAMKYKWCNIGKKWLFCLGQIQDLFNQKYPIIRHWKARYPKSDVSMNDVEFQDPVFFHCGMPLGWHILAGWTTSSSISFCDFFIKKSNEINGVSSSWLRLYCNSFEEASNLATWMSFSFGMITDFLLSPFFWNLCNLEILVFGLFLQFE